MGRRIREDCGALTFLDVDDVATGDNFKQRAHSEIRAAHELVALFTPWSARRSWVWIEVGAAWAQEKRVVAVLHGLSVSEFEEIAGGKGVFEDIHIIQLNDFDQLLPSWQAESRRHTMPRIFISHTSDSRDYARRLREALTEFGEAAFFDETEITPGESIAEVIRTKLQSADYFVVLLTERAAESPWVMFEIGAAEALGKRVLPILLADLDMDKLDYFGRNQLFLDGRKLKPVQVAQRIKVLAEQGE